MTRFRTRPTEVNAIRWTGYNLGDVLRFIDETKADTDVIEVCNAADRAASWINIHGRDGVQRAEPGDWIIRGSNGELHPCRPHEFDATYEPAGGQP